MSGHAHELAAALRAAGLTVQEDPGWRTRGNTWREGKPVGIQHHHTAPPVPYPITKLNGSTDGRVKCNINTKPDGTIWLIAYKACNYRSGAGSSVVLAESKAGTPPTQNAKDRGLHNDMGGNSYFFNFENDHAGDGGDMPEVQSQAIALTSSVVDDHFGITEDNMISHAEWTDRKIDPYFNQDRRVIEDIRAETGGEAPAPPPPPPPSSGEIVMEITRVQISQHDNDRHPDVKIVQSLLYGFSPVSPGPIDGIYGPGSAASAESFQDQEDLVSDGIVGPKTWAELEKV